MSLKIFTTSCNQGTLTHRSMNSLPISPPHPTPLNLWCQPRTAGGIHLVQVFLGLSSLDNSEVLYSIGSRYTRNHTQGHPGRYNDRVSLLCFELIHLLIIISDFSITQGKRVDSGRREVHSWGQPGLESCTHIIRISS